MITKLVTGLIGTAMMVVFLGYYAVSLDAIPLWIIIGSILAMVCWQFVETVREANNGSNRD